MIHKWNIANKEKQIKRFSGIIDIKIEEFCVFSWLLTDDVSQILSEIETNISLKRLLFPNTFTFLPNLYIYSSFFPGSSPASTSTKTEAPAEGRRTMLRGEEAVLPSAQPPSEQLRTASYLQPWREDPQRRRQQRPGSREDLTGARRTFSAAGGSSASLLSVRTSVTLLPITPTAHAQACAHAHAHAHTHRPLFWSI